MDRTSGPNEPNGQGGFNGPMDLMDPMDPMNRMDRKRRRGTRKEQQVRAAATVAIKWAYPYPALSRAIETNFETSSKIY